MGHYLELNLEVKLDCFKAQFLFILIAFKTVTEKRKKRIKHKGNHGYKYIIMKKESITNILKRGENNRINKKETKYNVS